MPDGDGAEPALCHRGFAGIVDDEGIDRRRCAQQRLGPARSRQRDGFSRQPFQRAVRAHMDHRIAFFDGPQPQIKRDVTMSRRAPGVVILGGAVGAPAAIRLHGDQRIAKIDRLDMRTARLNYLMKGVAKPSGDQLNQGLG